MKRKGDDLATLLVTFVLVTSQLTTEVKGHIYCAKDRWVYTVRAEDEFASTGFVHGSIDRSADSLAACATKCQAEDQCETFAFDKEDFKCQLINEPLLDGNDLVGSDVNTEAEGYRVYQPDCADGTQGGWYLIFKAGRGTGRSFQDDFDADTDFNTGANEEEAKKLDNQALFRHPDLNSWGSPQKFVDVEVRLYNSLGDEVFALRFDAVGKDKTTFFTKENLLYHPWKDTPELDAAKMYSSQDTDAFGGFPADVLGTFGITDAGKGGWMVVLESQPSDWNDVILHFPAFLYALPGDTKVLDWEEALRDGSAEVANSFAIFVR